MRLLVFGRTGQVATELRALAGPSVTVTALGRAEADLEHPETCAAVIRAAEADAVINAAAYTAVDRAEQDEDRATVVNGAAPAAMAIAAAERDIPFLHISTDYVFDGTKPDPWTEQDAPAPLGAYGRSKLVGEQGVAAAAGRHVILRTSWVHAGHGTNFVRSILKAGAARPRLTVVDDQRGGPTPAAAIAATLVTIAQAMADGRGASGIFHYSGAPATSWYGFAREIFARADLKAPELAPIRTADWPTPAARPANSVLDCTKIRAAFGIDQPDWRASLPSVIAGLGAQRSG